MGGLQLNLFGKPEVIFNGAPVTAFESAKSPALLAYLAVTGQAHSRDTLAALLWGDLPEATAKRNLTKALTNLRQLLEPYLLIERHSIAFNHQAHATVDAVIFQAAVESSALLKPDNPERDLAPLRQAVSLYRGDFLEGFYVKNALEFEEWALGQREYLRELMLQALQRLTEQSARLEANPTAALEYCRRWLGLEPWQEAAHRQMMLLLARSGQRDAALAQYETCRQVLVEEFGVEPAVETVALYERIKASGTLPPHNLPPPPNAFVGREAELEQIARHLADPTCRLVTILGTGGIGKTRLALEAARRYLQPERMMLEPNVDDGVYVVSLAAITTGQDLAGIAQNLTGLSNQLISAVAETIGFSFRGATDLKGQLLTYLRSKAMLLVLDNFEHLIAPSLASRSRQGQEDGLTLLAGILQQAPQVKLLVTSRERLNLQEEYILEAGGLTFPGGDWRPETMPSLISNLHPYSAIALFIQRAQQTLTGFSLSEADLPHVVRICQLVEGMPLGLELAASWLRLLSCAEIVAEIERSLDFLTTTMQNVPARHRSLRAVFEHSWELLSGEEQRVFCQLAVFRGGFGREAATQVTGGALSLLARLADKSFIRRTANGRYELHELMRQYAHEKLWLASDDIANVTRQRGVKVGLAQMVWQRHSSYYLNFVNRREALLRGSTPQQAISELRLEIDNIRQAWQWAMTEGKVEELGFASGGLSRFYDLTGLFVEGERVFGQTVAYLQKYFMIAGDEPNHTVQGVIVKLQVEQVRLLIRRGLPEQAVRIIPQAVELAHQIQDARLEATAYLQWGEALFFHGEAQATELRVEQALRLARSVRLPDIEAEALRYLGIAVKEQGEYAKALGLYEQSLACFRQLGDRRGESLVYNNLGILARAQGFFPEARSQYEQALKGFHEIGDSWGKGVVLNNLGYMLSDQGLYSQAQTIYQQGLQLCCEIKDRWGESYFLDNLGNILRATGDYNAAQSCYYQSLQIRLEIGAQLQVGETLAELALLHHLTHNHKIARDHSQRAEQIGQDTGSLSLQAMALLCLGHAQVALGYLEEGITAYQQAAALRQQLGEHHRATEAQAGLAHAYLTQGNLSQALAQAEAVLAHLEQHQVAGIIEPFWVYWTCYQVLQAAQDPRAREVLATAHHLLQERAANIEDARLRDSYLKNILAHREIVREFLQIQ
jgi:DNA-binding SARP family transcriptional activator/predicted ATPase/Tfp pilus assembly protein PilF